MAAGDQMAKVMARAAEQDLRRQQQIEEQKKVVNRLEAQVNWLLDNVVPMEGRTLFWAKLESGEFG